MKKVLLGAVMSGAMAVSFAPIAAAQPDQAGATVIQQRGTQNSSQIGTDNQSTQVYGSDNQSTTQDDRSQQAGGGQSAATGNTVGDERKRDNKGQHKGWEKNKHRERAQ